MNGAKYLLCLSVSILLFYDTFGQQVDNDPLFICNSGTFDELGITQECSFSSGPSGTTDISCDFDISGFASDIEGSSSGNITREPSGYDDVLATLSPPVNVSKINASHGGTHSIKLNNDGADQEATAMSINFGEYGYYVDGGYHEPYISFSYSAIIQTGASAEDTDIPRFIVRIYDPNNVERMEYCVDPINNPSLFTNAGNSGTPIYYSDWQHVTLYFGEIGISLSTPGRVEFVIIDGKNEDEYSTVYVDEVCAKWKYNDPDFPPPLDCAPFLILHTDISSGIDEREASEYIHAYNTISPGATALYHAGSLDENEELIGGEIVLLPGDGEDPIGFECLAGSTGHFYIYQCDGNFHERHAMPQEGKLSELPSGNLQIFPNPANSQLNVISGDVSLKAVKMMSLDGKLVLERQPGAGNIKDMKLDVNAISSGIYILTVETNDGAVTTHKIVKE